MPDPQTTASARRSIAAALGAALALAGCLASTQPDGAARDRLKPLPTFAISQRTTQPLLESEMPWESRYMNYFNVIRDATGWHMWYHAYDQSYTDDNDAYLCYAFSKDGVAYTRPELGLVEYAGSKNNNILIDGRATGGLHGGTVFLDPQAPQAERYKLVFTRGHRGSADCRTSTTRPSGSPRDTAACASRIHSHPGSAGVLVLARII